MGYDKVKLVVLFFLHRVKLVCSMGISTPLYGKRFLEQYANLEIGGIEIELGSLAEWVTGISELLAVLTALFLPLISEKIKNHRTRKRLIEIAFSMAKNVTKVAKCTEGSTINDMENYKIFKKYKEITTLITGDAIELAIFEQINECLLSLNNGEATNAEVESWLNGLHEQAKSGKIHNEYIIPPSTPQPLHSRRSLAAIASHIIRLLRRRLQAICQSDHPR
jgi:hypothetical protein